MSIKLEYIWLDGYDPTQNMRSKTKVEKISAEKKIRDCQNWSFDGSSTSSGRWFFNCLLKPVAVIQRSRAQKMGFGNDQRS
jgi:glutamine synthetase